MPFVPPPDLPDRFAAHLPFERGAYRLEAGPDAGRRLHFVDHGPRGARPVLLLHGNPTWCYLWRKVMGRLPQLRCVAPDLLGFGLSDAVAPREHSVDRHAGAVAELIEALELDDVVLVAQDWGGPIGCATAARLPRRITGRVFANTAVTLPERFRGTWFHRFARLPVLPAVLFQLPGCLYAAFRIAQGGDADLATVRPYAWARRLWQPRGRHRRGAFLALARMVPGDPDHPSVPALERGELWATTTDLPTGLVWGEKDPVLGHALKHARRAFPDAPVTRTSAGHFLQEQVPEELAAAVRRVAAPPTRGRPTCPPVDRSP